MDQYISGDQIKAVLTYDMLIDCMSTALSKFSNKDVVQPVRSVVSVEKEGGFLGLMPALCEDEEVLATKLVSFFPHNFTRYGVATHNAVIVVFDSKTGVPTALMDGDTVTAMRTAAASALATKLLSPVGVGTLAILGAGVQARSHFHALSAVRTFQQVRVWSRAFEGAEKCAAEIGGVACHTAEEAVRDADVIVTVTGSTTPVLKAEWVKPGAHINAVGACRHNWSEIEPQLMRSAVVYVDSREGALVESGDIILSKAEIYGELGEVILGKKEAQSEKTTVFKSLGMAIEDAMSAKLVLSLLQKK